MADRLSIDKKVNDSIVPKIDQLKLLGLDKTTSDRTELFLFAMALGVKAGYRTPLTAAHGFILEKSILSNDGAMSMLHSLLVNELRECNEEEKIGNKDEAFTVAQEYANTGFNIIGEWINNLQEEDENTLTWKLIEEMDQLYDEYFPDRE